MLCNLFCDNIKEKERKEEREEEGRERGKEKRRKETRRKRRKRGGGGLGDREGGDYSVLRYSEQNSSKESRGSPRKASKEMEAFTLLSDLWLGPLLGLVKQGSFCLKYCSVHVLIMWSERILKGYYRVNILLGGREAKREVLNRSPSSGHEKGWPHLRDDRRANSIAKEEHRAPSPQ